MMKGLFGKKSTIERIGKVIGLKPKRSNTALRSGLATAGVAAGLTVLSAVVSAVRDRNSDGGSRDDG